jgi:hypothetical protein
MNILASKHDCRAATHGMDTCIPDLVDLGPFRSQMLLQEEQEVIEMIGQVVRRVNKSKHVDVHISRRRDSRNPMQLWTTTYGAFKGTVVPRV